MAHHVVIVGAGQAMRRRQTAEAGAYDDHVMSHSASYGPGAGAVSTA